MTSDGGGRGTRDGGGRGTRDGGGRGTRDGGGPGTGDGGEPGTGGSGGPAGGGSAGPRRELAYAIVACLAGAGLTLFAATRTWTVDQGYPPAPLSPPRLGRTGGDLLPWLPALALVGLAGAGAVLATRGGARLLAGALTCGCGLAVMAGAGYAVAGGTPIGWPVATVAGGAVLAASGVLVLRRGRRWPALGARYARPAPRPAGDAAPTSLDAWAALDRGDDPTVGPAMDPPAGRPAG